MIGPAAMYTEHIGDPEGNLTQDFELLAVVDAMF
jgi:hypothetical protein